MHKIFWKEYKNHKGEKKPLECFLNEVHVVVCKIHVASLLQVRKDLGIQFWNNLYFNAHINAVVNKVNSLIGLVKRNFIYMDKNQFLILYKSLFGPILTMVM